ncbi:MAG: ACT domain-containing protein [Clostridia bacterium]|nr:ACT domain-containing protein [Clostridia bacterium]
MRAFVTVMGQDRKGIIARTSTLLADNNINILDINQTIIQSIFTMVMLVDIESSATPFSELVQKLEALGEELGLEIRIQHEDIFKSMHRI